MEATRSPRDYRAKRRPTVELDEGRVLAAAEHLPEPTRTIFRLHRLQGMTQAEVARRQGVSVTTVENHVRSALQRLAWARSGR